MFFRTILAAAVCVAALAAADATGTWKLNLAKSQYQGVPPPKAMTVVYTPQGDGYAYKATGTAASGDPIDISFQYTKDGVEVPLKGHPYADTLTLKNGHGSNSTGIFKRAGKPAGTVRRVISADGKTMTLTATNVSTVDGKKGSYTAVYEKQ